MSPAVRNYKEGSVIYFEGDEGKEIYILKSGRVVLVSQAVDTGEEVREEIKTGEFFGVKSVLGGYRREETAQVLMPSTVLVFTQDEFERLIAKNFDILMKLLRVFSNQLRRIGKRVRELLGKGESKLPATELFNIGEYYYRRGKREQALYAYRKYQEYYPTGEFYGKAKERMAALMSGAVGPSDASLGGETGVPAVAETEGFESPVADFLEPGGDLSGMEVPEAPSVEGFESPIAGLEDLGHEVREQWEKPAPKRPTAEVKAEAVGGGSAPKTEFKVAGLDIAKKYYDGLSLFSQEKYEEAMASYAEVLAQTQVKDSDLKFVEKAAYERGRCLMKLERWQDAVTALSDMVRKFQKSDLVKEALFLIGECYERLNNPQKAVNFYQKVMGMPPRESINNKAKQRIEALRDRLG